MKITITAWPNPDDLHARLEPLLRPSGPFIVRWPAALPGDMEIVQESAAIADVAAVAEAVRAAAEAGAALEAARAAEAARARAIDLELRRAAAERLGLIEEAAALRAERDAALAVDGAK